MVGSVVSHHVLNVEHGSLYDVRYLGAVDGGELGYFLSVAERKGRGKQEE